jgi:hypothetical protein
MARVPHAVQRRYASRNDLDLSIVAARLDRATR